MNDDLRQLLPARKGHFRLESGHHSDLWLDLDALFLRPARVEPFAVELARRLAGYRIHAFCGPMTGGAFLAQIIARQLDVEFIYTERLPGPTYRLPAATRRSVRGKHVAVVDDVINAGSAVGATCSDIEGGGGIVVAIAALLTLGSAAQLLAASRHVPLEAISRESNTIWDAKQCPLCASGVPLDNGDP